MGSLSLTSVDSHSTTEPALGIAAYLYCIPLIRVRFCPLLKWKYSHGKYLLIGIPLKWHNYPVNYFRITFLSASSEKNVQILFHGHKQRGFIWNTNLLSLNFPSFCDCLLQIWVPYVLRVYFVQHWPFHFRKWCTQLFAQVTGLHMLTVHGAIWHHSGTRLSASSQNPSHSLTYPFHNGAEPQEASQSTAVDVKPLFIHYRSDSCLPQSSFPVVVRWGSRHPGGRFCVRVSPIWISSNGVIWSIALLHFH